MTDLPQAHHIPTALENTIRSKVPHIERALIHTEPMRKEPWRVAVPLQDTGHQVADKFGMAPLFATCDVRAENGGVVHEEDLP